MKKFHNFLTFAPKQNKMKKREIVPVSRPVCLDPKLITGVPKAPASLTPALLLPIISPAFAVKMVNSSKGMCLAVRHNGWFSIPFNLISLVISLLPVGIIHVEDDIATVYSILQNVCTQKKQTAPPGLHG